MSTKLIEYLTDVNRFSQHHLLNKVSNSLSNALC